MICDKCKGNGTLLYERGYHGERSEFWPEACSKCGGSGRAPATADALESVAQAIESITLHQCNAETGHTNPRSADWLDGNDAGVVRGLRYAAKTVRMIAATRGEKP